VQALADAVPGRYGALVQVLAFGGLRFRRATALRRAGGDRLRVERSVRYVHGRWPVGEQKTDAGRRLCLPARPALWSTLSPSSAER
jgi:hypothetical protein